MTGFAVERRTEDTTDSESDSSSVDVEETATMGDVAETALRTKTTGAPVDPRVRSSVESHLGVGLGHVRVHDDRRARASAEALHADAFTHGSDVFLGPGSSGGDLDLMAHELTHVVQQGAVGATVQRRTEVAPASDPAEAQADAVAGAVTEAWIVDGGQPRAGAMTRDAFMAELERQVTQAANDELGPLWSAAGCPYIASFFARHRTTNASRLERMATLYSGLANPASAMDYVPPIVARVRRGVRRWRSGGDVSDDLRAVGMGGAASQARDSGERAREVERSGSAVQRRLADDGTRLDSGLQQRMGDAFGHDFSDVRIHTGPRAALLASSERARAFTEGQDVVFGSDQYRPGSLYGDALLAHELAHVVQQRTGNRDTASSGNDTPDGALESDADTAAETVMARLHGSSTDQEQLRVRPAGSLRLQRCSSDGPAETDRPDATSEQGRFEGREVGWHETLISGSFTTTRIGLDARDTLGFYESEEAAIAMAMAGGRNGGAVTIEGGRYVAYQVLQEIRSNRPETFWERQAGMVDDPIHINPGVLLLVTADGAVLRAGDSGSGADRAAVVAQDPFVAESDALSGYREAFDSREGRLQAVDDKSLLFAFDAALRANALDVLARSEGEVRAKQQHLSRGGTSVSQNEIQHIRGTIDQLIPIVQRLDRAEMQMTVINFQLADALSSSQMGSNDPMPRIVIPPSVSEIRAAQDELAEARRARGAKIMDYPILARFGTVRELEAMKQGSDSALTARLGGAMPGILESITETRHNVMNGSLNVWSITPMVNSTIAGLGITDQHQREVIMAEKQRRASEELRNNLILAAFTIGLAIGAAFVSGPAGLAMAAGALGLGVYDAVSMTNQYFVQQHASNTHLDPAMSVLPPDMAAHWGWLVVAWAGVLLDVADVAVIATRIGRGVTSVARGSSTIAETAEDLARAAGKTGPEAQSLVARLRHAAGDFDPSTALSFANKAALENRIGTTIQIVDDLFPTDAVHILYRIDNAGNVTVVGCRAGRSARAMDVAAHAGVVRLLRRYDGVIGSLRQLTDRIRELLRIPASNVPPSSIERGSAAWETWMEVSKHQDLIAARTSRLGNEVTTAQESALRADVEFFESELAHHRQVLRQLGEEAGTGVIGFGGRSTRSALDAGYKLPGLENVRPADITQQQLDTCDYYYRASQAAGEYTLVRKARRNAPPRVGHPDGTITEGALSRADKAAQIVARWPQASQDAFTALADTLRAAGHRLVPVNGLSNTGRTMRQVIEASGALNFEARFLAILTEAATRRGVAADEALRLARESLDLLMNHSITVVRGTDQLRAFGYRSHYLRQTGAVLSDAVDLHHLIPLYLGGGHTIDNFARLPEDLHNRMHQLIDTIQFDDSIMLAPHAIQRASSLTFEAGAAVLRADGTVELLPLTEVVRRGAAQATGAGP